MKKLLLLLALALQATLIFAQEKEDKLFIGTSMLFESDTPRTFLILGIDQDSYQKSFFKVVGKPATNTTGVMQWNNVAIDGLPGNAQLKLTDGIMTRDLANKSACFTPFTDHADKKKKLAALQSNQERRMEISILSAKGENIVRSLQAEEQSKAFLYKAYAKN